MVQTRTTDGGNSLRRHWLHGEQTNGRTGAAQRYPNGILNHSRLYTNRKPGWCLKHQPGIPHQRCYPCQGAANGWHFFLEYGPRSELVVRSQAFCRRQTAAMQRIAAFGAAKRKCAGTRRRPCRRSTPVRPIYLLIYNVLTTQKEAPSKRMAFLFGIRLLQCPLPVTIF